MTKQEEFNEAIKKKNIELFNSLLKDNSVDPAFSDNSPFLAACESGCAVIVKKLLQYDSVDPSVARNYSIFIAAYSGHQEIVKILLNDKRVDPSDRDNYAIHSAYKSKFHDITKWLFKDQRVKDKIKIKNINFYNFLMKNELESKIENF
jgi:ankyrin repeat protein